MGLNTNVSHDLWVGEGEGSHLLEHQIRLSMEMGNTSELIGHFGSSP